MARTTVVSLYPGDDVARPNGEIVGHYRRDGVYHDLIYHRFWAIAPGEGVTLERDGERWTTIHIVQGG
jgi:hypothetical protein